MIAMETVLPPHPCVHSDLRLRSMLPSSKNIYKREKMLVAHFLFGDCLDSSSLHASKYVPYRSSSSSQLFFIQLWNLDDDGPTGGQWQHPNGNWVPRLYNVELPSWASVCVCNISIKWESNRQCVHPTQLYLSLYYVYCVLVLRWRPQRISWIVVCRRMDVKERRYERIYFKPSSSTTQQRIQSDSAYIEGPRSPANRFSHLLKQSLNQRPLFFLLFHSLPLSFFSFFSSKWKYFKAFQWHFIACE